MSTVFITHEQPRFDYGPAEAFGDLDVVTDRVYSMTPGNSVNGQLAQNIIGASNAFDPDEDYVLPSGSAVATALFYVRLAALGHRRIRTLLWNHNESAYSAGVVDLTPFIGASYA